jgi:crotonobetainyl-CoA:carnitine CoA-transferase CaiB-like acyl-CoA transferase
MNALEFWPLNQSVITRAGPYRYRPAVNAKDRQNWPSKDGYVHFLMMGGIVAGYMTQLVKWMDEEGAADDYIKGIKWAEFDMAYLPQSVYDALEEPIGKFFLRYTMKELYDEAVRRRIQLYPVCNAREIAESPQLEARDFWQKVEHLELKTSITYPGAFLKMTGAKCGISRRAPLIGEHNEEIYCGELGLARDELALLRQADVI